MSFVICYMRRAGPVCFGGFDLFSAVEFLADKFRSNNPDECPESLSVGADVKWQMRAGHEIESGQELFTKFRNQ